MKRLSLQIPEEEHRKLKLISAKTGVSMVKIVLNCISERFKELEKLEEEVQEMQQIINRLRREKMEITGDYKEEGVEAGFEWAKDRHYSEIQDVLAWESIDTKDFYPETDGLKEVLMEYFFQIIQEDELMDTQDWLHDNYNEYTDKFITGWQEGVEAFWNKVKDKI